jgi:hypothetical protein
MDGLGTDPDDGFLLLNLISELLAGGYVVNEGQVENPAEASSTTQPT